MNITHTRFLVLCPDMPPQHLTVLPSVDMTVVQTRKCLVFISTELNRSRE